MDMLFAGLRVRNEEVRFHVVAFAFFEDLVRAVLVFILDIKDGVDEVFALQRPEAILPAETREHGAVVECGLAVQVQLSRPPCGCAVIKLGPVGMEVVAASLGAHGGEILDLEVAGFFEIVVVGDKVRILLSQGSQRRENREYGEEKGAYQNEPVKRGQGISLQVICNKELRLT